MQLTFGEKVNQAQKALRKVQIDQYVNSFLSNYNVITYVETEELSEYLHGTNKSSRRL